ncbi:TPA: hypothetical protein R4E87_002155 [Salmonella enterica subsp. enterica serovar Orientalis]|nr:hypothetical protein [Salmonella enterica subsp. enterica serovar Orientalis]
MPLPLREYYPIERAAELLECTTDDLVHWARFGYIQLCINLNQAYGILNEYSLEGIVNHNDFSVITEGTQYEDVLNKLELSKDDVDNYSASKIKLIHKAMLDYVDKNGGTKCLNKDMCFYFAHLDYFFRGCVCDDLSRIVRLNKLSRKYFRSHDGLRNIGDLLYDDKVSPYVVIMDGFFALDDIFLYHENINAKFVINNGTLPTNQVFMPGNNLLLNIIVDDDVYFSVEDLYILKNDFVSIQKSIVDGSELSRKYSIYRRPLIIDESDNINHLSSKKPYLKDIHEKKRIAVIEAAMKAIYLYPESCKNFTKWAETVHEHSYTLFGGECPLSFEITKRLIGKIIKKQQNKND